MWKKSLFYCLLYICVAVTLGDSLSFKLKHVPHKRFEEKSVYPQQFIPREVLASRLREHLKAPATFNIDLLGSVWPTGGYFTTIYVGTPAQPQLVQVDTGSSDLLVAQAGCKGCPNTVQYNPALSSTSIPVYCPSTAFHCTSCSEHNQCGFNNTYQTCDFYDPEASCSLIGVTYYDNFSFGSPSPSLSARVGLGGITLHSGAPDTEFTNMPGVLGMAFPPVSGVWLGNTVFDTLVHQAGLQNMFGLCFGHKSGTFTIGGQDPTLYTGSLQYTPITHASWYVIVIEDMSVDGKTLGLAPSQYNRLAGGTIIDSGTNTFVVDEDTYDVIFARFVAMCSKVNLVGVCGQIVNETLFAGNCFDMTSDDIAKFPSVGVKFKGINNTLEVSGFDYLWPHPELQGKYCLEIQSSGVGGFTILGNVFQLPYYIVFDRENLRLGFGKKNEQKC